MVPELEQPCEECDGTGFKHRFQCYRCRGRGAIPNDRGNDLLSFILHHVDDEHGQIMSAIRSELSSAFESRRSRDDD